MTRAILTRRAFYDLVWSKPMTHFAKDFGMFDGAVRKHCIKHDTPTPSVGHWAKVAQFKLELRVPAVLPQKPHLLMKAIRAGLRRAKADQMGFNNPEEASLPEVSVARSSVDRVLRILQTMFVFAESQGHNLVRDERSFYWLADGERFLLRLYEILVKKPHEPTVKESEKQADEDAWREKWRNDTSSSRKVYRKWDYFPSDRLTIAIRDTNS